jgi:hypothetical protein
MNSDFTNREAPVIPQELIGSNPREVRLSEDGITLWIFVALLLAWIPIFAIWICIQTQKSMTLRQDGRIVIGKITEKWIPVRGSASIRYTFTVDGVAFSGKSNLPVNLRDKYQVSGNIPVRFLPNNPNINHPDAWEWSAGLYLGAYIYMVCASIFSIWCMITPLMERKMAREGKVAVGIVTSCKLYRSTCSIKYIFRTEDGRSFIGSGASNNSQQIGASILVIYLSNNPKRNSMFPLRNYQVVSGSIKGDVK